MLPVDVEPTCVQIFEQRIIRLGGAVDDDSCNLIVAQLLWLDATDPKKVTATTSIKPPHHQGNAQIFLFEISIPITR